MDVILSGKVLDQQFCTECLNYLSVGPVMVSSDGEIICGRCSDIKLTTSKIFSRSLYNLVAEKLVFKCVNYYQGCEELLLFNEAKEHEVTCTKSKLKCPFCEYEGNGCQVIQHFDKKHRNYVWKEDTFKVVLKETASRNLVVIKRSSIFCLTFAMKDTRIEIHNLLITPAHLGPEYFKLRFCKSYSNIEFVTPPIKILQDSASYPIKNFFVLDQALLENCFPSGWCFCKIELINDDECDVEDNVLKLNYFEKIVRKMGPKLRTDISKTSEVKAVYEDISCVGRMSPSDLRKFVNSELCLLQSCVNCKRYITNDVYFCSKYHMACKECSNSKCPKCNVFCAWSLRPELNISLPCEWRGCSSCPGIFDYALHKRDCKHRTYKCPDLLCGFEGCIKDLKRHWHMSSFYFSDTINFFCQIKSTFFWLGCNEMFRVSVEFKPNSVGGWVYVNEIDTVMSRSYKFTISFTNNQGFRSHIEMNNKISSNEANKNISLYLPKADKKRELSLKCSFRQ